MPLHLSSGKEREATLGPWPSFLWLSSVIQSWQLADRGEGVSQEACFPEASSSLPHLGSSKDLQASLCEGDRGDSRAKQLKMGEVKASSA